MTTEPIRAFRDALASGDTAAATDHFDDVDDALSTQSDRESAVRDVARNVIARVPPSDPAHEAAQAYVRAVFEARQARIEMKQDFALHLSGGPAADAVAEKADRVLETIATVESAEATLRSESQDLSVSLSPTIRVFPPNGIRAPKGSTIEETVTVENVGFADGSGLAVSVKGYDLTVSSARLDTLPAGEQRTVTLTGTADEATRTTVTIAAGAVTGQTNLTVLSKRDYVERAIDLIQGLQSSLAEYAEQGDQDSGSGNGESNASNGNGSGAGIPNGLSKKLSTAEKRLERVSSRLDAGTASRPDEKLLSTAKLLGAFVNQVEGVTPRSLSSRQGAVLSADAEQIIDVLHTATSADR